MLFNTAKLPNVETIPPKSVLEWRRPLWEYLHISSPELDRELLQRELFAKHQ